jgi:hypothetical protein
MRSGRIRKGGPESDVDRNAQSNAEARQALLSEFGGLSGTEVSQRFGATAASGEAVDWKAENRLVGVPLGDEVVYPRFQFTEEGEPRRIIAPALHALRADPTVTAWQAALWFIAPNGWLGGRRPVDLLDSEPDAVVEAAGHEATERVF